MAIKRFDSELPIDIKGQKTTAVPVGLVESSEWVTPIFITNTEALSPEVTISDLQVIFPDFQNVKDADVLNQLIALEGKIDKLMKRNSKEPFDGSVSTNKTFASEMIGFVISNDGALDDANLSFEVNGDVYTVMPGEVWDDYLEPFTQVLVTTTVPFRAYGRG